MNNTKQHAVVLSAIVALSIFAGAVAFAGSAAAGVDVSDRQTANATITGTPADYAADANANQSQHVITMQVGPGLAGTSSNIDIVADYSGGFKIANASGDRTPFDESAEVAVESIEAGSVNTGVHTTTGAKSVTNNENNITVEINNANLDDNTFNEGDIIRIVLTPGAGSGTSDEDFQNPRKDQDNSVRIVAETTGGSSLQIENTQLDMGTNADINVESSSLGISQSGANYSSLQQAISDQSGNDRITIRDDVYEIQGQPVSASGGISQATTGLSDFTIESADATVYNVSVANGNNVFFDLGGNSNNVTVDTVGFAVDDEISAGSAVNTFVSESTAMGNLTVTDSEFYGSAGTAVVANLDEGAAAGQTSNEFTNNVFENVDGALDVDTSGNTLSGNEETITVKGNTINPFSGDDGIELTSPVAGVDVTFENNDIDGQSTGTNAIDIAGASENLNISGSSNSIDNVATGVEISGTGGANLVAIGDYTFSGISSEAINIDTASTTDNVTVRAVDIDDSKTATGVLANDGAVNLEVNDGAFGDNSAGDSVMTGIDVDAIDADIRVDGSAINVSDSGTGIDTSDATASGNIKISSVDIDGTPDDGASKGININNGDSETLIIDPGSSASDIADVDTGIDIQTVNSLNDISNTTVSSVGSTGISVGDGTASLRAISTDTNGADGVDISSGSAITITDSSDIVVDGDGAGVKVSGGTASHTIQDSTITVKDDSDARGIVFNTDTSGTTIQRTLIQNDTSQTTASAGIGVEVNDAAASATLQYNDITNFAGAGLDNSSAGAGDSITDATANWWGSQHGPTASDGSDVNINGLASTYDPFLTADTATVVSKTEGVDSLRNLQDSDIKTFGHDVQVANGETIAFPGTSAHNINKSQASEFQGVILGWDAANQRYYDAAIANNGDAETPQGLDAYKIIYQNEGDPRTTFLVEYATDDAAPGEYTYEQGYNLVSPARFTTDAGGDLGGNSQFGLDTASNYEVFDAGAGTSQMFKSVSGFSKVDADSTGSIGVSPFQGYWVYKQSTGTDTNINAIDSTATTLADVDKDGNDQLAD